MSSPQLSVKNEQEEESSRETALEEVSLVKAPSIEVASRGAAETIAGCSMHAKIPVPSEMMEESGEKKASKSASMHR